MPNWPQQQAISQNEQLGSPKGLPQSVSISRPGTSRSTKSIAGWRTIFGHSRQTPPPAKFHPSDVRRIPHHLSESDLRNPFIFLSQPASPPPLPPSSFHSPRPETGGSAASPARCHARSGPIAPSRLDERCFQEVASRRPKTATGAGNENSCRCRLTPFREKTVFMGVSDSETDGITSDLDSDKDADFPSSPPYSDRTSDMVFTPSENSFSSPPTHALPPLISDSACIRNGIRHDCPRNWQQDVSMPTSSPSPSSSSLPSNRMNGSSRAGHRSGAQLKAIERSPPMDFAFERNIVGNRHQAEGFSGNFADFDFGDTVPRSSCSDVQKRKYISATVEIRSHLTEISPNHRPRASPERSISQEKHFVSLPASSTNPDKLLFPPTKIPLGALPRRAHRPPGPHPAAVGAHPGNNGRMSRPLQETNSRSQAYVFPTRQVLARPPSSPRLPTCGPWPGEDSRCQYRPLPLPPAPPLPLAPHRPTNPCSKSPADEGIGLPWGVHNDTRRAFHESVIRPQGPALYDFEASPPPGLQSLRCGNFRGPDSSCSLPPLRCRSGRSATRFDMPLSKPASAPRLPSPTFPSLAKSISCSNEDLARSLELSLDRPMQPPSSICRGLVQPKCRPSLGPGKDVSSEILSSPHCPEPLKSSTRTGSDQDSETSKSGSAIDNDFI